MIWSLSFSLRPYTVCVSSYKVAFCVKMGVKLVHFKYMASAEIVKAGKL